MGYSIVLKKNETATMFFLKKASLVNHVLQNPESQCLQRI